MYLYSVPTFTNPNNGLTAELSQEAIALARESIYFLDLIQDVIRRIAFQEVYRINQSIGLAGAGALNFFEGQSLTLGDVNNIGAFLVPIHKLKLATYVQSLAKTLTINEGINRQLSEICRSAIVNNGLLHILAESNQELNVLELKVPATYDTDGITPLTTRKIVYADVLYVLQIMLANEPFLTELMDKVKV